MERVRKGVYLEQELIEECDRMLDAANARSRNDFINKALRFYIGYLKTNQAEDYQLQSVSSMVTGTIRDTENRLARMDFKLAVEIAKLSHIMATVYEVDEETLEKLQQKCVEEVKRINGAIWFEDVYRYQNEQQ
jgi:metal-responsive CopG/Arc/MetJ family transcriptional regulator